jgi:type VI secretion system protein VasG
LLDTPGCDFGFIARHFEVDTSRLTAELGRSLDKLKTGNARTPAMSPSVLTMLREAWTFESLEFDAAVIRTGNLILALAEVPELARMIGPVSAEFQKIKANALHKAGFDRGPIGGGKAAACGGPSGGFRAGRAEARGRRKNAVPRSVHGEPDGKCAQRKD